MGLSQDAGSGWLVGRRADSVSPLSTDDRICSPPFMELTSVCGDDTMQLLEKNGLAFPFSVCRWGPAGRVVGSRGPGGAVCGPQL